MNQLSVPRRLLSVSVLRRGGGGAEVIPAWEQLKGAGWQFHYYNNPHIGWFPAMSDTTYEAELARISKDMGWDVSQTLPQKHLTLEERKYWDWNDMFFLKVTGFAFALFFMMEDYLGNLTPQNRREAILRIEEAAAKGQSPISPDYAPADQIEKMVPPPGDWEKIWLARQPTTMVRGAQKWCW